jgi:hypothetical protein
MQFIFPKLEPQMNLRHIAFMLCLGCSMTVNAIQPVEVGLHPLYARIQVIESEQQLLNQILQTPEASASERASSYHRYKLLEQERNQLAREIANAKKFAQSPLVTFMAPVTEAK